MKKKSGNILLTVKLAFSASSFAAGMFVLLRILYGILPAVYVMLYARFIDGILQFYAGGIALRDLLGSLVPVLLITLFQYCGTNLTNYFRLKCNMNVIRKEKLKYMDKCRRIPYVLAEDKEFRDLMYSVDQGTAEYINGGLFSLLGCVELALNIVSILAVIFRYSPIAALVILILFVPVVWASLRSGKNDYAAFEKYQATERYLNSYEDILTEGKYADERILFGFTGWFLNRWMSRFDEASSILLGAKKKLYLGKGNQYCHQSDFMGNHRHPDLPNHGRERYRRCLYDADYPDSVHEQPHDMEPFRISV